jgi:hypothetical protein
LCNAGGKHNGKGPEILSFSAAEDILMNLTEEYGAPVRWTRAEPIWSNTRRGGVRWEWTGPGFSLISQHVSLPLPGNRIRSAGSDRKRAPSTQCLAGTPADGNVLDTRGRASTRRRRWLVLSAPLVDRLSRESVSIFRSQWTFTATNAGIDHASISVVRWIKATKTTAWALDGDG